MALWCDDYVAPVSISSMVPLLLQSWVQAADVWPSCCVSWPWAHITQSCRLLPGRDPQNFADEFSVANGECKQGQFALAVNRHGKLADKAELRIPPVLAL